MKRRATQRFSVANPGRINRDVPFPASLSPLVGYSVRKINPTYSGSALQIRRSSDNTAQDIGFDANNNLNIAAALAFCGAGDGFISVWYDQYPGARNLAQPTAASQPQFITAGALTKTLGASRRPFFTQVSGQTLSVSTWGTIAQPFTRSFVAQRLNSSTTTQHLINGTDSALNTAEFSAASNTLQQYAGTAAVNDISFVNDTFSAFVSVYNGASSYTAKPGSTVSGGNPGTQGFGGVALFRANVGGFFYQGAAMAELVIFNSALSASDAALLLSNQQTYFGPLT